MSSLGNENIDETNMNIHPSSCQGQDSGDRISDEIGNKIPSTGVQGDKTEIQGDTAKGTNVITREEMPTDKSIEVKQSSSDIVEGAAMGSETHKDKVSKEDLSINNPECSHSSGDNVPSSIGTPPTQELTIDTTNCNKELSISCSESPTETSQKSPEMILDEVQEEVTKLNISGELSKQDRSSKVIINDSLRSIMAYDFSCSETDSEDDDKGTSCDSTNINKPQPCKDVAEKKPWRNILKDVSGSSDSESDSSVARTLSSDSESDSDNDDSDSVSVIDASDDGVSEDLKKNQEKGAVKKTTAAVLDYPEFLPPIPDLSKLNINADVEFMHIGKVSAVITDLVTIEAIPGTPAFDLDSMLFIDDHTHKKPIGPIFDVLGPVSEPIYCVRFNGKEEIERVGIKTGMKVYAAPKSDEFTKFVFVRELMKIKGSDASWLNDQEQPTDLAEFSDDEQERAARRAKTHSKRKLDDSSLERHRRYEKTMNQCNTLNTKVCKLKDAHRNLARQIRSNQNNQAAAPTTTATTFNSAPGSVPVDFNPAVPPPGFWHPSPYSFHSSPFATSSPAAYGQSPQYTHFPASGMQNSGYPTSPYGAVGTPVQFGTPAQFGSFYANQSSAPQSFVGSPGRWQSGETYRRGGPSPRARHHRQSSDNYFTNNSRNVKDPSSPPF